VTNSDWLRKIADEADRLGCHVFDLHGELPNGYIRLWVPDGGYIEIGAEFDPVGLLQRISIAPKVKVAA
jgi:hypothetical protein